MASDELWHLVEARRDDGAPAMFRIRELEPRLEQPRIFVVEVPYPVTALSRLPDAAAYRRLATFEEQWLGPACAALAWTFVAAKTEDGSSFLYLYGSSDPTSMVERLSPFDGALGFFDELDPQWDEYAALRELLAEANAMPPTTAEPIAPPHAKPAAKRPAKPAAKRPAKPAAKRPAKPAAKPAAKRPAKPAAKRPAKPARPAAKRAAKPARPAAKRTARPAARPRR